jgi:hypothetical protein
MSVNAPAQAGPYSCRCLAVAIGVCVARAALVGHTRCAAQVPLQDACAVLDISTASWEVGLARAQTRGVAVVLARERERVCVAAADDAARRIADDADQTRFAPRHYAALLRAATRGGATAGGSAEAANTRLAAAVEAAARAAAGSLDVEPGAWSIAELATVVSAAATYSVPAHRTFCAAAVLLQERLRGMAARAAAVDADALLHVEAAVWAYAVTRRAYPYSADAVCREGAAVLAALLAARPASVDAAVMAEMLWTFAARWQTSPALFHAAARALDDGARPPLAADVAESLAWAFVRAGVPVPKCVAAAAPASCHAVIEASM